MRVPLPLQNAFGADFQKLISQFGANQGLLPEPEALVSKRFLARSVVPHIEKLSLLFNRQKEQDKQAETLGPYWKESSNPLHLRGAYLFYFMPCNLFRVASVWAELSRLGFRWSAQGPLRGVEFGAGPAAGASGIAAGEHFTPVGLPREGNWALIEQDKAILSLGEKWAETYFESLGLGAWGVRPFHRKLDLAQTRSLLPPKAPKFNLWVMSYFLNEISDLPSRALASIFMEGIHDHLDEEGVVILVEPALKQQSRKLLQFRRDLIAEIEKNGRDDLKIIAPCLGHQACGALEDAEDWCHEEVTWWRPPYLKKIDEMAELDRKTLPFSYLVLVRSKRSVEEILPALRGTASARYRLVSPAHKEGQDMEFFLCGQEGKRRVRSRIEKDLERGDILSETEIRGDKNAGRIERGKKVSSPS